jgi:hypothetical protein
VRPKLWGEGALGAGVAVVSDMAARQKRRFADTLNAPGGSGRGRAIHEGDMAPLYRAFFVWACYTGTRQSWEPQVTGILWYDGVHSWEPPGIQLLAWGTAIKARQGHHYTHAEQGGGADAETREVCTHKCRQCNHGLTGGTGTAKTSRRGSCISPLRVECRNKARLTE